MSAIGSGRAFSIVFAARVASAGMAFLAIVLVARHFGPERFGAYSVLLATLLAAVSLASPALDTGMVRFVARAREDANALIAYFFRLKLYLALATLTAGLALAVPLHRLLLTTPDSETPGPSAFVVVFASASIMVMWSSMQAWCQAGQRFHRFASQEAATALLRLGWVVLVLTIGGLGTRTLLAGYGAAAAIIAAAGFLSMPREIWRTPRPARRQRRDIAHFTKWVLLAGAATALAHRLDLFLLAAYNTPATDLGHYGAALNLALIGELALMSLFHVLLPMASALQTPTQRHDFLIRHQKHAILIGLLLLPLVPIGSPMAALLFGAEFRPAGVLFGPLIAGLAFTLASAPAYAVLYAAGHGRAVATLEGVKLLVILAAGLVAIPIGGPFGMACTVAAARGAAAALTYAAARKIIARDARNGPPDAGPA